MNDSKCVFKSCLEYEKKNYVLFLCLWKAICDHSKLLADALVPNFKPIFSMLNLKSIIALSDPPLSIPIHYQYEVTKWGGVSLASTALISSLKSWDLWMGRKGGGRGNFRVGLDGQPSIPLCFVLARIMVTHAVFKGTVFFPKFLAGYCRLFSVG